MKHENTFNLWLAEKENELNIKFAETGMDREADFDWDAAVKAEWVLDHERDCDGYTVDGYTQNTES